MSLGLRRATDGIRGACYPNHHQSVVSACHLLAILIFPARYAQQKKAPVVWAHRATVMHVMSITPQSEREDSPCISVITTYRRRT